MEHLYEQKFPETVEKDGITWKVQRRTAPTIGNSRYPTLGLVSWLECPGDPTPTQSRADVQGGQATSAQMTEKEM